MRLKDSRAAPSRAAKDVEKNCEKPHSMMRSPMALRIMEVLHPRNLQSTV